MARTLAATTLPRHSNLITSRRPISSTKALLEYHKEVSGLKVERITRSSKATGTIHHSMVSNMAALVSSLLQQVISTVLQADTELQAMAKATINIAANMEATVVNRTLHRLQEDHLTNRSIKLTTKEGKATEDIKVTASKEEATGSISRLHQTQAGDEERQFTQRCYFASGCGRSLCLIGLMLLFGPQRLLLYMSRRR